MKYFSLAALELLEALKNRGARLNLEGENIVVRGYLTDDLRHQIREHKQGLLKLVKDGEHKWQPVEQWSYWRDGVWMVGTRLDKPRTFQFWFVQTQMVSGR